MDHPVSDPVLNHPSGKIREINSAACDPSEPTPLTTEGTPLVLVYCLNSSFGMLIREQAWDILRIHILEWEAHGPYDQIQLRPRGR